MRRTANQRRLKNYLIANKVHFKMMLANLVYTLLIFVVIIFGDRLGKSLSRIHDSTRLNGNIDEVLRQLGLRMTKASGSQNGCGCE